MTAAPPKISHRPRVSPVNAWFAGIVLAMAGLGVCTMVFFFNPTTHAFYPVCQFHRLTGLNCPGCGATRALYALLHGNIATALRDNALFLFALTAAGLRGIWLAVGKWRQRPVPQLAMELVNELVPKPWVWPFLIVAAVFTVLRNLPAFSFLSPA